MLTYVTHSYDQMNGAQFTAAMADLPYNDVLESSKALLARKIPDHASTWLLGASFNHGPAWAASFATKYATGILKFYNNNQKEEASK